MLCRSIRSLLTKECWKEFFAYPDDHIGDRLNHSMIIRILFGLGTAFALVLESYAQFPGETAPGIKVSQEEINKVSHKRTHKQIPEKKRVAPRPDKQTAHKLRRFVSQFVLASCSRNANRDQRRFFAKHANYLGKTNLSRTAIGAAMMRFNTFWTERKYSTKGKPSIGGPFDGTRYTVRWSFTWTLAKGPWESKGTGVLHLRIRRLAGGQFEILSMSERKHLPGYAPRYFGSGYG
jgi:hypothetical protein